MTTATEVIDSLPQKTDEELSALLTEETHGKQRVTVLSAIQAEQEKRSAGQDPVTPWGAPASSEDSDVSSQASEQGSGDKATDEESSTDDEEGAETTPALAIAELSDEDKVHDIFDSLSEQDKDAVTQSTYEYYAAAVRKAKASAEARAMAALIKDGTRHYGNAARRPNHDETLPVTLSDKNKEALRREVRNAQLRAKN
jgi:hypothetical protein